MNPTLRKALFTAIALLIGVIVGIGNGLLTHFGGAPVVTTIRDGAIGFAAASAFVFVVLAKLGLL
ncbi:hypothetical protein [Nocardia salmonicida]|uniref:hypothetical protein n=1 Tax=Nocardia salmonicida TaxID=53431 RepID=UPI003641D2C2